MHRLSMALINYFVPRFLRVRRSRAGTVAAGISLATQEFVTCFLVRPLDHFAAAAWATYSALVRRFLEVADMNAVRVSSAL